MRRGVEADLQPARGSTVESAARRAARGVWLCVLVLVAGLTPAVSHATPDSSGELRRELDTARDRLDSIEVKVEAAVEDYNEAAARLREIEERAAALERRMIDLQGEVDTRQDTADGYVRGLYKSGPSIAIASFFSSEDAETATDRATTLRKLTENQLAGLEHLAAQRTTVEALGARLEDKKTAATAAREETDAHRVRVEAVLTSHRASVEELTARVRVAEARERREAEARARREAARRAEARAAAARESAEREAENTRAAAAAEVGTDAAAPAQDRPAPDVFPEPVPAPPAAGAGRGATAVEAAMTRLGKPYVWAAAGPDAFDCSGLTMWAWAQAGVSLPHSSRMQYSATRRISRSELQPGDLVFRGSPIHHVSMYIGGGKVIDAPYSGQVVRIDSRMVNKPDVVGFGRP